MNTSILRRAGICFASLIIAPLWTSTSAQVLAPPTPNRLKVATEFLRTFYPELNGKNYFLDLETSLYYDQAGDPFGGLLWLTISELPKGYEDVVRPCPPGTTPTRKVLGGGFIGGTCPEKGIPPQQFLSAVFHFDAEGHLVTFSAGGPATTNPSARETFAKARPTTRPMTGAELIAAFKSSGGKYGPDDKEELIKSLPLTKLEHFLGKLTLIFVEFDTFQEDDRSDFDDEMRWDVRVSAKRDDGTSAKYLLRFDQYNGKLVTACDLSQYPCNSWTLNEKDKP